MSKLLTHITVRESDILDGNKGACLACGDIADGIEPDACGYTCDSCDAPQVYGLEELLLMGKIELIGDDDEDDHDDN